MPGLAKGRCWSLILPLLLLTGCGGKDAIAPVDAQRQAFDDLRAEIREIIPDADRQTATLESIDALAAELTTLRQSLAARRSRFGQLNADYDTSRAAFEALFADSNARVRANQRAVLQQHLRLRILTTDAEWQQLSKNHTAAMKTAAASLLPN